jgi:CBS domain-containing protein
MNASSAPAAVAPDVPLDEDRPSLVMLELIHRLKVRDVMTRDVLTAQRQTPLRTVQHLMRDRAISGVPVAENGRLFGLVSTQDIINALEGGYIDEPSQRHMSSRLVVLEDDMPLAFAVRYFGRYPYGRFPVLNREQLLVGILSQRDINRALLRELSREVKRLETQTTGAPAAAPAEDGFRMYMLREFAVAKLDFENAGKAANQIRVMLFEKNIPPRLVRRVAVAAYELEMNLCVHSAGGVLSCLFTNGRAEIIARDSGPGIPDVDWACRDGTSTATAWVRSLGFGAGMGLPNVKRVSDEFSITSAAGAGTTVRAIVNLTEAPAGKDGAPRADVPS